MSRTLQQLANEIGAAAESQDLDKLNELAQCFREAPDTSSLPLSVSLEFDPEQVDVGAVTNESDVAVGFANSLSRARRRVKYEIDKLQGVRRPVIVSEGDSWFQYPITLNDVIDQLIDEHEYQVYSLGKAGDLLALMVQEQEYVDAIESEQADLFLLSAGGNDMLGGGRLGEFLEDYTVGMPTRDIIDRARWESFLGQAVDLYQMVFAELTDRFSQLQILCHGYDYVLPQVDGKWLGGPLAERGIPRREHANVVAILIDEFNARLAHLANTMGSRVHHVDCRNAVGGRGSWHDELHPKNAGYGRVARRFADAIESIWNAESSSADSRETPTSPEFHEMAATPPARRRGHFGRTPLQGDSKQKLQSPLRDILSPPTLQEISRPALGGMKVTSAEIAATEAVISDPYRTTRAQLDSQSTPRIPSAALPRSVRQKELGLAKTPDAAQSDLEDGVLDASQNIRFVSEQVAVGRFESSIAADGATETISQRSDDELRRRPPCESLEVWQAHLRSDPENLIAYEEYRVVKDQFDEEEDAQRLELRRSLIPVPALSLQERILGDSDLFQINFLSRGVRAARTVGRITAFNQFDISLGSGTGFVVAPGLLLTNNHVLPSASIAKHSHILFEYEYDERNHLKVTEQFEITDEIFCTSVSHDFSFVSVEPIGSLGNSIDSYGQLQLIRDSGKALKGEPISIIQHADGLPKQLAIRNSRVVGRARQFIYYTTDTNPGASGAPVVTDEWFPVALHHRSVPHYFETCAYVANRGIRISAIYAELDRLAETGSLDASSTIALIEPSPSEREQSRVRAFSSDIGGSFERKKEPFHEVPYTNRKGYDPNFLDAFAPMPEVIDPDSVAAPLLTAGSEPEYELKYEHFSVIVNRERRLAMVTAANVDFSRQMKRPGNRRREDYTRKGLGDLGRNDREMWFEDPRLASEFQIPDRFYNKDRQAFHKGHIVRRDAVAWGHSYAEMKRANGDTYHVTNCSPQVGHFNSALESGIWGQLENEIGRQGRSERLCVFAGPVFSDQDRDFHGVDNSQDIIVPIPSVFWKIVVASEEGELRAFAFWLQQNLNDVAFEFSVPGEWRTRQISIAELERKLQNVRFDQRLHDADQLNR